MNLDITTIYKSLDFLTESIRLQYTNFIYTNQDRLNYYLKFDDVLNRLRMEEPIEYVFNMAVFCNLRFYVDKRCLIPRPETQDIVNKAIEFINSHKEEKFTIIDIGTGSGCIIISILVKLLEDFLIKKSSEYLENLEYSEKSDTFNFSNIIITHKFIGIDISRDALTVAEINRAQFGLEKSIELINSSFEEFDFSSYKNLIICSNLPYIPDNEDLQTSVKDFEPKQALFGGVNGDELNKKLIDKLLKLNNVRVIFMEGYNGEIHTQFLA